MKKTSLKLLCDFGQEVYILDIFRMISVFPGSSELFKSDFLILLVNFCINSFSNTVDNIKILAMRVIINLFTSDSARLFLNSKRQDILDAASANLDNENKNIKAAFAGLLLNFSIEFYDKNNDEATVQILSLMNECISLDSDTKNLTNILLGTSNMIYNSNTNLQLAKDIDLASSLKTLKTEDQILKELLAFLIASLK